MQSVHSGVSGGRFLWTTYLQAPVVWGDELSSYSVILIRLNPSERRRFVSTSVAQTPDQLPVDILLGGCNEHLPYAGYRIIRGGKALRVFYFATDIEQLATANLRIRQRAKGIADVQTKYRLELPKYAVKGLRASELAIQLQSESDPRKLQVRFATREAGQVIGHLPVSQLVSIKLDSPHVGYRVSRDWRRLHIFFAGSMSDDDIEKLLSKLDSTLLEWSANYRRDPVSGLRIDTRTEHTLFAAAAP